MKRRRMATLCWSTRPMWITSTSAQELVSVAASLVPFLEHDDANRALMGATCAPVGSAACR